MNTTELIELLKSVEFGASGRPREISISYNSEEKYFPAPDISISSTGYAVASVGDSINLEQPNSKTRRGRVGKGVANILNTGCNQGILENDYRIRKLVPLECWRLMGFTDEDYWKARQALEKEFYNGRDRSNSQMYKMAGNSIVVDVLEGILKNLIS